MSRPASLRGPRPSNTATTFVLLALVVGAFGCRSLPDPAAASEPTVAADVSQPRGRMVQVLAEIAARSDEENPYLGDAKIRRLRAELAALPEDASIPRRWLVRVELGKYELRRGNEDEALRHYREAYELLGASADPVPRQHVVRTLFECGVAYMRWAETQNCVARHTSDSCIFPIRGSGVHVNKQGASEAARFFEQVLQHARPESAEAMRSRWLLNIAHMTLGSYPDGVPEKYLVPPSLFESDEPFPRFLDVAPDLGLNGFDLAGGALVEDLDGDGRLDIVTSSSDTRGQLRYWRNAGDGKFSERTDEAGLRGQLGGLNLIHADYDNDSDADILVLRGGWWRDWGRHPNSLLRNDGGVFTDVTFEAGLAEPFYPTQTGAWADYDNDGDLDLYVGNETDLPSGESIDYATTGNDFRVRAPSQLFRNNGDGTFTDVAAAAGVENLRYTKAVVWGDFDGDRFPDLYVSNMGDANRLYRNNGDGTFTDVAEAAGVDRPIASFPSWFWDVNDDGALDLFVSSYGGPRMPADVAAVAASYLGMRTPNEPARLYLGDGRGGFTDVAEAWGITRTMLPMGGNFGDVDNDGLLDFYLGTGYPYYEGLMPNLLFRHVEGGGFADVTFAAGVGHLQKGHGVVFADLDDDGDQDLLAQVGGAYPGDAFGNALFANPGFEANWVKLKLVGTRSNRSAIGARLRLRIVVDGRPRELFRYVNTGGSFGSNPLRREIGLGLAEKIEWLEVYWPASDLTQRFDDVPMNRMFEITEGPDGLREIPLTAFELMP